VKEKAVAAQRQFKIAYQTHFAGQPYNIETEALAIGRSVSQTSKYLTVEDQEANMPAALVPLSGSSESLMNYLADQCGGTFVAIHGRLHASDQAELCAIIRACSDLVKEKDPKVRERLFRTIEKNAVKAVAEDQEVAK
jgi:hypothetical protein